jgi:hypothetical protein
MKMNPKSFFAIAAVLSNLTIPEAVAQRVTAEDMYGDIAGGPPNDLLANIIVVIIAGLLIYGILTSKGVRLAVGIYLMILLVACGGAALAFNFFGKSGAIIYSGVLVFILYLYDNSSTGKNTPGASEIGDRAVGSGHAFRTRSDFNTSTEYYKYAVNFKTNKKYHWYKIQGGIGIKETGEYFPWPEVEEVSAGFNYGYWINLSNEANKGRFFVEKDDIETIGVDYKSNKFISQCPSCNQKCRGSVFREVSIRCPKCGFKWSQRVN